VDDSDNNSYWDWVEYFREMDDEAAHVLIRLYEQWTDLKLETRVISQEEAWDCYFGLLHECDCRDFLEDRRRILQKIDTKRYDPMKSSNIQVVFLALFRARDMGLI
jgi:hypothetical protein